MVLQGGGQRRGPGGAQHKITTATHYESVDANGRASIKKHGAGPERKNANDPDSDY